MKRPLLISLACFLLATATSVSIATPDPITDSWHADLQIPTGTLIFTITPDDEFNFNASMESPDQASGSAPSLETQS